MGGGEGFGAGLPGRRAEAGAAVGFGQLEQDRVEFFEDGLGRFALEGVDFFRAEFSRGRCDAEVLSASIAAARRGRSAAYASRTCSQTVDQARPLSSSMPSQPRGADVGRHEVDSRPQLDERGLRSAGSHHVEGDAAVAVMIDRVGGEYFAAADAEVWRAVRDELLDVGERGHDVADDVGDGALAFGHGMYGQGQVDRSQ